MKHPGLIRIKCRQTVNEDESVPEDLKSLVREGSNSESPGDSAILEFILRGITIQ